MLKTNSKEVKEKIENYIIGGFDNWLEDNILYVETSTIELLKNYYKAKEEKETTKKNLYYTLIKKIILKDMFNAVSIGNKKDNISNFNYINYSINYYGGYYEMFRYWATGLPSILNCDFVYNVSAKDLLGYWLEETEEEKNRYSEQQAEEMTLKLIFRELRFNTNIYDIF